MRTRKMTSLWPGGCESDRAAREGDFGFNIYTDADASIYAAWRHHPKGTTSPTTITTTVIAS